MDIVFKKYVKTKKAYLWNIYSNAMKGHIEDIWGWDEVWQENDFENNLQKFATQILYFKNVPIGYLQTKNNSDNVFINMIILKPDYQSKGLGARILNMIQSLRTNTPLKLKCFRVNDAAYRFYLKSGFTVTKNDEHFIYMRRANA